MINLAIAKEYQKPFVTVHHLEAHCMITRLAGEVIQPQQPTINTTTSTNTITSTSTTVIPGIDINNNDSNSSSISPSLPSIVTNINLSIFD